MKINLVRNYFLIIILFVISSCNKKEGFYSKEQRELMRTYEPNNLFTNYRIAECDKFIQLKKEVSSNDSIVLGNKLVLNVDFTEGSLLRYKDELYTIDSSHKTFEIENLDKRLNNDLEFEIDDELYSFPKLGDLEILNIDELKEISIGTKIRWKPRDTIKQILIAIKPSLKYCGKEDENGISYGTRPILVQDIGEYVLSKEDIRNLKSGMEVGILIKRGMNKVERINDEREEFCISSISWIHLLSKIK